MSLLDVISLVGAIFTFGAYLLLTMGKIPAGKMYHVLNLTACVLLGYVSIVYMNPGYMFLNSAWGVVAVIGLVKEVRKNASANHQVNYGIPISV